MKFDPMKPAPPVTSMRRIVLLQNPDSTVIAEHQLVSAWLDWRARDLNVAPNQAFFDPVGDVDHLAVLEDDAVLDLTRLNQAVVVDRCKRPDVRVDDNRLFA